MWASLLLLWLTCILTDAKLYRWYCRLSGDAMELARNPDTGEYIVLGKVNRGLLGANEVAQPEINDETTLSDWYPSIQARAMMEDLNGTNVENWTTFIGKDCLCSDPSLGDVFCPIEFSHCAAPHPWFSDDLLPGCVTVTPTSSFVRSVWPFVVVWFVLLFTCLIGTRVGRGIADYAVSWCFPWWPRYVVDRILRNDPNRARRLIQMYARRHRRTLERRYERMMRQRRTDEELPDIPTLTIAQVVAGDNIASSQQRRVVKELALKTRVYNRTTPENEPLKKDEDDNDPESDFGNDDDDMCTICFGPLEDGDRVGVLSCNHVFHVSCLKTWLVRRNQCPLCAGDAAVLRYHEAEEGSSTEAPTDDEERTTEQRSDV